MENTLFLFQNPNSKYPILCAPDDVNGISYKSSPKGWMNSNLFADYFRNTRVINPFTKEELRNCGLIHVFPILMDRTYRNES